MSARPAAGVRRLASYAVVSVSMIIAGAVASASSAPSTADGPTAAPATATAPPAAAAPTDAPPGEPPATDVAEPPATDVTAPPEPEETTAWSTSATDTVPSTSAEPADTTTTSMPAPDSTPEETTIPEPPSAAAAPTIDQFAIALGDTVSEGSPGPGAGVIEAGGSVDVYTFATPAGEDVTVDVLAGDNVALRWRLDAPDGSVVFDGIYTDRIVAAKGGTYTLTVSGASATSTGTYSFRVLLVPPAQAFAIAIGDTVAEDAPGTGAGNIEAPGALDRYTFDAAAGQGLIFDLLAGRNTLIAWRLTASDGTVVFDSFVGDRQVAMPTSGTYTLDVHGLGVDDTGTYSFQILAAGLAEGFGIAIGDLVADGVSAPGSGNLEGPGATDEYQFEGLQGQTVHLDVLAGSTNDFRWSLTAPDGSTIFDSAFVDHELTLADTGMYSLVVRGLQVTDVGTYSFDLREAPPLDVFTISIGETVSDGVPAVGAGNIETPSGRDRYRFDAIAGAAMVFDVLAPSGPNGLEVELVDPDGQLYFAGGYRSDHRVEFAASGAYELTVSGDAGTYSFRLIGAPPDDEFDIAIGDTVADGVPAPGAGNIESIGAADVYTFDGDAGQAVRFDVHAAGDFGWRVVGPDGHELFSASLADVDVVLTASGAHTLQVDHSSTSTGTYSFTVVDESEPPETTLPPDTTTTPETTTLPPDPTTLPPDTTTLPPDTTTVPPDTTVPTAITADIDVLVPCIRDSGPALIPFVVYGASDLDVDEIDLPTVELDGMPIVRILRWPLAAVWDIDGDQRDDLIAVIRHVGGRAGSETTTATLDARLDDGTTVTGRDEICTQRTVGP